jgi:Zn-dependent peptidase ImmA (M78 family)
MGLYSLNINSPASQKLSVSVDEATDFVIERARELFCELVKQRGNSEPPFTAREYAALRGISKIEQADLNDAGAILVRHYDSYIIKINMRHHPNRQNFSCAHEIGHTIIHELNRPIDISCDEYRSSSSNTIDRYKLFYERLCDTAAAELLMPENVFLKYLAGFGLSINSIERLATVFKVSIQAAAIRIGQISTEPCYTISWKQCQMPRSRGFKGYFARKPLYIRNPSPISRAFESDKPVRTYKYFEIDNIKKRCLMESKAFGQGKTRYVISLVFESF